LLLLDESERLSQRGIFYCSEGDDILSQGKPVQLTGDALAGIRAATLVSDGLFAKMYVWKLSGAKGFSQGQINWTVG
jgi:alkyl hydroperoxide reductase subunit AhpF